MSQKIKIRKQANDEVKEKYFPFFDSFCAVSIRRSKKKEIFARFAVKNGQSCCIYKSNFNSPSNECVKISYEMFDFDLTIVALFFILNKTLFFSKKELLLSLTFFLLNFFFLFVFLR
jgi:hypothetical protein